MRTLLTTFLLSLTLISCGGDGKGSSTPITPIDAGQNNTVENGPPPENTDPATETLSAGYEELAWPSPATTNVKAVSGEELSRHIKNGLRLKIVHAEFPKNDAADTGAGDYVRAAAFHMDFPYYTSSPISGVEKPDTAKHDNEHWFLSHQANYHGELPGFTVVATNPTAPEAAVVASHGFSHNHSAGEIHLHTVAGKAHYLITLHQTGSDADPPMPEFTPGNRWNIPQPTNGELLLTFFNVADPENPEEIHNIRIDGNLIESRKIADTLYLITRYDPWPEGLQRESYWTQSDPDSRAALHDENEEILANTQLTQLLPRAHTGEQSLSLSDTCHIQDTGSDNYGFSAQLHITALDVTTQEIKASTCISQPAKAVLVGENAIYLLADAWSYDQPMVTAIHKFSLTGQGIDYAASGTVIGTLGNQRTAALRVHEHNNELRIVTSRQEYNKPFHQLHILRHTDKSLAPIASVPDESYFHNTPASNLQKGAVAQFTSSHAFIQTSDHWLLEELNSGYIVDLRDHDEPKIVNNSEISFRHATVEQINDNYLLILEHEKAKLIGVAGAKPELIAELSILEHGPYGHSEAVLDSRAISIMMDESDVHVVFPQYDYWRGVIPLDDFHVYQGGFGYLRITDIHSVHAQLHYEGMLVAASNQGYWEWHEIMAAGPARAVLQNGAAFAHLGNRIWSVFLHQFKYPSAALDRPSICDPDLGSDSCPPVGAGAARNGVSGSL